MLRAFVVMEDLGLVLPARDLDEETVQRSARAWASVLSDLTPDELEEAVVRYVRSGVRWWPAAGELLRFVPRLQGPAEGEADLAWGELLALIRRFPILRLSVRKRGLSRSCPLVLDRCTSIVAPNAEKPPPHP